MEHHGYTGLEFMEGFSLFAGALWLIGALALGGLVMMGNGRLGDAAPAPGQPPAMEAPAPQ